MTRLKYLIFIGGSLLLSLLLTYVGQWWLIIVGPMVLGFFLKIPHWHAFLSGALSISLFWGFFLAFRLNTTGSQIMEKIAFLLPLGGSRSGLIVVTLLIGGFLGGLAGLNGSYWRRSMGLTD